MAKKVYAYTDTVPASAPYITAGKRYEVDSSEWEPRGFTMVDDEADKLVCVWGGCPHLEGGNWTREEVEETP